LPAAEGLGTSAWLAGRRYGGMTASQFRPRRHSADRRDRPPGRHTASGQLPAAD
jgi:hypothetical protein